MIDFLNQGRLGVVFVEFDATPVQPQPDPDTFEGSVENPQREIAPTTETACPPIGSGKIHIFWVPLVIGGTVVYWIWGKKFFK